MYILLLTQFLCTEDNFLSVILSHHEITCPFPPSASVKEVSSDARALGIRAEMNSRRCWEAELESGSGKEPSEPTKLKRSDKGERRQQELESCSRDHY